MAAGKELQGMSWKEEKKKTNKEHKTIHRTENDAAWSDFDKAKVKQIKTT